MKVEIGVRRVMSAMTLADAFRRAADLIEPEGRWTQGEYARDKNGDAVDPRAKDAVCWCAVGAILLVGRHFYFRANRYMSMDISKFNDTPGRTQKEVVRRLREAADAWEADVARDLAETNSEH